MSTLPTTTPADVEIGSCKVQFNSTDLGGVSGAITVSFQLETLVHTSEQFNMIEEIFVTFRGIQAQVPLNESSLEKLQYAYPGCTYTSGTKKKIEIGGSNVRLSTYAHELKLDPVYASDDNEDITIHKCVHTQAIDVSYAKEVRLWPLVFIGMRDSTKDDGNQLFTLGDPTAS